MFLSVNRIKGKIQVLPPFVLVIFTTVVLLLIDLLFHYIFYNFNIPHSRSLPKLLLTAHSDSYLKLFIRFVEVCIIAPVVETFVFQYLLFVLFCTKFKLNLNVFYFLGAFVFGLTHFYSVSYIVVTFTICLVFNFVYAALVEAKGKGNAYYTVVVVHSLYNAVVFVDQFF